LRTLQVGLEWFPERPGGLNRVFYDLARHLPEVGVEFTGLVTGSEAVGRDSRGAVVPVCPTAAPLLRRWWQFRRHAARRLKEGCSLVAGHFALNTFPLLGVLDGYPLVIHFHGPWASEAAREGAGRLGTGMRRAMERAVYRRGALGITLSQAFARVLETGYGVPADRIRVVPGGVDLSPFAGLPGRDAARSALGWPGDRPIVLAVRRLVRRMGLEDLIAAADLVRRSQPDVLLLIAGGGALRGDLEGMIAGRGLGNHVRLLGRLPDTELALAYRAADLTVVPTVALEGFGLIVVESLAAGTPVLVTPVGGLPEVVAGLSPGLVIEATGPAPLADALLRALRGELELPGADACREYAAAHYDCRRAAARVAEVYREALG
jgi:glycosyltransferase involved in cell wall biosynthesis